jgi:hypothetical protein
VSDSTLVGLFCAFILTCLAVRPIYTAWVAETTVRRVRRWRAESVRAAEEAAGERDAWLAWMQEEAR